MASCAERGATSLRKSPTSTRSWPPPGLCSSRRRRLPGGGRSHARAAGLVTCAWLRELGLGRAAALAGGLAFEIAPYRAAQSTAHLLAAMSILVPLSLWAFERARRGSVWWHAVSAAALASIS